MSFSPAPIAIFAFNRPAHLRRTVEALRLNELAEQSEVFFFCDGPRRESDVARVQEVRAYLAGVSGFRSVTITAADRNLGLAGSIIRGVTEIVNRFGRVIVLEDDMVTSRHFLRYMNDGLERYEGHDSVASIHGYVYPLTQPLPETFFLRGADCWGWATWARAWRTFEPDGQRLLAELERRGLIEEFDFNGSAGYSKMLRDQIAGKNDSWAVRWYASAFLAGRFTLYPGRSLVANIGNDGSGRHASKTSLYASALVQERLAVDPIAVTECAAARAAFAAFFAGAAGGTGRRVASGLSMKLRNFVRSALPPKMVDLLRRALRRDRPTSQNYQILAGRDDAVPDSAGWTDASLAATQHACFQGLLAEMRQGRPRDDFKALVKAVAGTGSAGESVVELGCGSGWNYEVLRSLWRSTVSYTGVDISPPMIGIAQKTYPEARFEVGDAMKTRFADASIEVVISGTVLMHLVDYAEAIRECARISSKWCIFHTVPVLQSGPTKILRKLAYGQPTVEVVFSEADLKSNFAESGLRVVAAWPSLAYDLAHVLGQNTSTKTYLCRKE